MKRNALYILAGIVLTLGMWQYLQPVGTPTQAGHSHSHDHDEDTVVHLDAAQISALDIQTKLAEPGELAMRLSTLGKITLHPDRLAHILPKISGVAKEARKNIGDVVQEGEILAILESREIAEIAANYLAAKEKVLLTDSLLDREQRLREKKVSAEQDFLNAKTVDQEAKIHLQLAKQKLEAFGIRTEAIEKIAAQPNPDLKLYEIRSPMKGVVIARHITKGEYIENTSTIYEIADLSTVWIEIGIYPKDLIRVHTGQLVDLLLPDGTHASAEIIYVSPIIQDETITAKAIAQLQNPDEKWRPGAFVKVNIATQKIAAPILIPKTAIQEIDGKPYVFLKIADGFELRPVQLGASDEDSIEIISGLKPGEEYAATNTFILKADLRKEEAEHEH